MGEDASKQTHSTDEKPCKNPTSEDKDQKRVGPNLLQIPKASNLPDRYMSPTDRIISPVSRGILARNLRQGNEGRKWVVAESEPKHGENGIKN